MCGCDSCGNISGIIVSRALRYSHSLFCSSVGPNPMDGHTLQIEDPVASDSEPSTKVHEENDLSRLGDAESIVYKPTSLERIEEKEDGLSQIPSQTQDNQIPEDESHPEVSPSADQFSQSSGKDLSLPISNARQAVSAMVELPFSAEIEVRPSSGDSKLTVETTPTEAGSAGMRSPLSLRARLKHHMSNSNAITKPKITRQKLVEKTFEFAITRGAIERELKERYGTAWSAQAILATNTEKHIHGR